LRAFYHREKYLLGCWHHSESDEKATGKPATVSDIISGVLWELGTADEETLFWKVEIAIEKENWSSSMIRL
jgi:hypothetical protein